MALHVAALGTAATLAVVALVAVPAIAQAAACDWQPVIAALAVVLLSVPSAIAAYFTWLNHGHLASMDKSRRGGDQPPPPAPPS